ncbi:DUF6049 family protein [Streptomyces fuscigenes]|uniref:DUF6049 family protein n=1 Tax=Streptomyces fuscigenes TaxID=1528880 RepID=UPI001F35D27D|nr:DUF6049 family protein [Streptomyces fuscigenes]MCF3960940.1 DUF6049 family protein [Streptomyces fuscigenes]
MADAAHFRGTGHWAARRWLRRTASVVAGAPLLAGLLAGTAAPAAHAAPSPGVVPAYAPQKASNQGVSVALNTFSPSAPVKGDTLTISGTVTNNGRSAISDGDVDLRVGPRLSGRSAIDDVASRSTSTLVQVAPLGGKYRVAVDHLAPKARQDFALSVPVSELGLDEDGVYQLGVSLSGETSQEPWDHVLGMQRTFLPWQPDAVDKKTKLSFMWPLVSKVHLSAQTGADEQQTPVFDNDDLAADLAPGGRLQQMVSLGSQLPVTWVIDPDLLATVDAMTHKYSIKKGNTTVPGKNQQLANQWLNSLEKAVQHHPVVALPFADPDLASLAHTGRSVSGSLSHLQPATQVAATTVQTILHVKPSTDFAWPVDGAVDPSIVDVATSAGADKVITRSDSLSDDLSYTPSAPRPIGGGTTAVDADSRLSEAFQGDLTTASASTLAVQRFLAQSLAVAQQDTGQERSIVVAPQRMPNAGQVQAMAAAMHGLDAERWSEPQNLTDAASATPDPDANTRIPRESHYPRALRKQELPTSAFQEIQDTQDLLVRFTDILSAPDRVVAPFANAQERSMSASWRGDAEDASAYRGSVKDYLTGLKGEVLLVPKSDLTLSGASATIPVTVQNKLLQDVQHLVLRLSSSKPTRLKLDGGKAVADEPIRVGGGHSQSVKFTGTGNANGPVEVSAQLFTEDGHPYSQKMTFQVRVSEITPTAMLVIASGVLLLAFAGVKMYSRRKRTAARRAAAEAARGDGPDDGTDGGSGHGPGTGPGGEQPSDPAVDTGPGNPAPSGSGEKVDR